MPEPLFKESCRPEDPDFIKRETLAQVFSCEFFEISKNTFSYRTPPVATSDVPVNVEILTQKKIE